MTITEYEERLKLDRAIDWLEREIVAMKVRAGHAPSTDAITGSGVHPPRVSHRSEDRYHAMSA